MRAVYVTVYFYQANIFDRHIYCVGSLESSPNTPVTGKNSDLEIYLESWLSVQQSQRSVMLLPALLPTLLDRLPVHSNVSGKVSGMLSACH